MKKLTFCLFLFLSISSAMAQTIRNVAKTGTDAGNCGGAPCLTINYAIGQAVNGDIVQVADGNYTENVVVNKNINLRSVNGRGLTTITGISNVGAPGTINVTTGSNAVQIGDIGKGFRVIGIDNNNVAIENAAIYFTGNHTNTRVIGNEIVANGDAGLLTEFNLNINGFIIDNNIFSGKTFIGTNPDAADNVPRQLVVMGCSNNCTTTSNISFTNNQIIGVAGGVEVGGITERGNTLITIDAANVTVTCNTFAGTTTRFGASLRTRGSFATQTIQNNTFSNANISASARPSMIVLINTAAVPADYNTVLAQNTVDAATTVRSVTSTSANGTYVSGNQIDITVQFSSPVIVTGTPQISLNTTPTNRLANYLSGSGTCELTFRYTVQESDESPDLDYASTSAILLNGGTITNGGINSNLTLPTVGGLGSLGANKNIVIDGLRPVVSSIVRQNPTEATADVNSVVYRVTFSKAVTGVGTGDFSLTNTGTIVGTIASVAAVSTSVYDITINAITGAGTLRLDVPATATINDLPGNALTTAFNTGEVYTIARVVPTVLSIVRRNPTTEIIDVNSVVYRITFSEPVTNFGGAEDLSLTTTGTAVGAIAGITTTSPSIYDITVNTITGVGSLRLDVPATATVNDLAGNNLVGGFSTGQVYTILAPTVTGIVRLNPTSALTGATSVVFRVTFSKTINNIAANRFTAVGIGSVASVSTTTGTSVDVTVTMNQNAQGSLRLDVPATSGMTDGVGNNVQAFSEGESYNNTIGGVADNSLNAVAGSRQVILSWGAADLASGYEIYMYSANQAQRLVGTTANTTFTVTGLENGVTYFFRIRAVGSQGNTDLTAAVSARPSVVLGTEEETASNLFRVYPNPSNGSLSLRINELKGRNAQINVLDMSGRVVFNQAMSANGSLETELNLDLAQGMYLLQVSTEKENLRKKIIMSK